MLRGVFLIAASTAMLTMGRMSIVARTLMK